MGPPSRCARSLAAFAAPADSQIGVNADAALNSPYVWRGLTIRNRFVIQPDLVVNVPIRRGSLSLGTLANIEPLRYDGADHFSEAGGQPNH